MNILFIFLTTLHLYNFSEVLENYHLLQIIMLKLILNNGKKIEQIAIPS